MSSRQDGEPRPARIAQRWVEQGSELRERRPKSAVKAKNLRDVPVYNGRNIAEIDATPLRSWFRQLLRLLGRCPDGRADDIA
jgi:hypothetical protein